MFTKLTLLLTVLLTTAHAQTNFTRGLPPGCDCSGTNAVNTSAYICGDPRLGPLVDLLPTRLTYGPSVADVLTSYSQIGGECPIDFLRLWTNATTGQYIYPPSNGFALDIYGQPIQSIFQVTVGTLLDRFGSEYGTFVGPYNAPYLQRSLPPSNLNTNPSDPRYPEQYHVYNVTRALVASVGPIAAWFGQPGFGVQYQFSVNILTLVNGGYLERVNLTASS